MKLGRKSWIGLGIFLGAAVLCTPGAYLVLDHMTLGRYLHPDHNVTFSSPLQTLRDPYISPRRAARHAARVLRQAGVEEIQICQVDWIVAPVGGYIVDATGRLEQDGVVYTRFRVGVRDGSEEEDGAYVAGEPFVTIAHGEDRLGRVHWDPPGGPTDPGNLAFEFLPASERPAFENLDRLYP